MTHLVSSTLTMRRRTRRYGETALWAGTRDLNFPIEPTKCWKDHYCWGEASSR